MTVIAFFIGAGGLVAGFELDNAPLIILGFYAVLLGFACALSAAASYGDEIRRRR